MFDNINVKDLICVTKYIPDKKTWKCENRTEHILGIHIKGLAKHIFQNYEVTLKPGDVYFFNQRDDYSVKVLEIGEAYSIHFTTYEPIAADSFFININNTKTIVSLLNIIENQLAKQTSSRNVTLQYFYKLCAYTNTIASKKYQPANRQFIIGKNHMDLHYKEKSCIDDAALVYGVSRRRFNDIFKEQENCTPNEYIIEKKCNLAKALLKTNMYSVTQISELCGFDDVSYFSKTFKKITGMQPSKYK